MEREGRKSRRALVGGCKVRRVKSQKTKVQEGGDGEAEERAVPVLRGRFLKGRGGQWGVPMGTQVVYVVLCRGNADTDTQLFLLPVHVKAPIPTLDTRRLHL